MLICWILLKKLLKEYWLEKYPSHTHNYLSYITKADVETVLTGVITSHQHNYLETETDPLFQQYLATVILEPSANNKVPTSKVIAEYVTDYVNRLCYNSIWKLSNIQSYISKYFRIRRRSKFNWNLTKDWCRYLIFFHSFYTLHPEYNRDFIQCCYSNLYIKSWYMIEWYINCL